MNNNILICVTNIIGSEKTKPNCNVRCIKDTKIYISSTSHTLSIQKLLFFVLAFFSLKTKNLYTSKQNMP